ncbi:ABC transporter permease [Streptomyces benahoarensis]|uniref:ABC transporter permease subunit n=1 Tax=Streptomyces benahoarensis TaxID=2595054 RepID=A0A553ZQA6_9ACTN|nr:ABC transporter permease subunit [Streptomyces benahoarensis]TSB31526.1 ABC transporter permease subunit [Streptomyces benahoarensis]TSB43650.1 ABC transporter permease subunit [Streptomyces benahoarensis]
MPVTDLSPVRGEDVPPDFSSGADVLDSPTAPAVPTLFRRSVKRATAPVLAAVFVLSVWQLAALSGLFPRLPSPVAVLDELAKLLRDGILLPALGQSLGRAVTGFAAAVLLGVPLGLLVYRYGAVRTVLTPVLAAFQSLPAAALVPLAVVAFGESERSVYSVVLLGAVPSLSMGVVGALDQVPVLLRRAGRAMGATGLRAYRHVLVPAALPGLIATLRQGWTFGWRALMTAELITSTPLPGVGRILDTGKQEDSFALVMASVALILAIGVLVEAMVFRPVEKRVLYHRGLLV